MYEIPWFGIIGVLVGFVVASILYIRTLAGKKQTQLNQTYEHSCQNGTEVKIVICMELNNFNEADLDELRSYFAECSHNYYLHGILA